MSPGARVCVYCGRNGRIERDHITGRNDRGVYFDRDLWLTACRTCNTTMWQAWDEAGLGRVTTHAMSTRLLRSAFALEHAASSGRDLVLPAPQVLALARLHRDATSCVWRSS